MPGSAAAKSDMTEYWNIREGFEEAVRKHFEHPSETDVTLDSVIPEKDFNSAGKGSADVKNLLKRLGVNPVILRRVAVAAYEAENQRSGSLDGRSDAQPHLSGFDPHDFPRPRAGDRQYRTGHGPGIFHRGRHGAGNGLWRRTGFAKYQEKHRHPAYQF